MQLLSAAAKAYLEGSMHGSRRGGGAYAAAASGGGSGTPPAGGCSNKLAAFICQGSMPQDLLGF
jgi:hypothetical protein